MEGVSHNPHRTNVGSAVATAALRVAHIVVVKIVNVIAEDGCYGTQPRVRIHRVSLTQIFVPIRVLFPINDPDKKLNYSFPPTSFNPASKIKNNVISFK